MAIEAAKAAGAVALSKAVFAGIVKVLARPKLARFVAEERRNEILDLLSATAFWFEPQVPVRDCRDSNDNKYPELALAADASAIVSRDKDLLVLNPWRSIPIFPARVTRHAKKAGGMKPFPQTPGVR